ncbi:hypothetical protein KC354_g16740 [Hortaea werneckii]|nr:hypothetical protein KC354_g16740 [Hortaea werneckii]
MSFNFTGAADSPTTPNRKNNRSLFSQPSTTPAGPPPSHLTDFASHISTTPAGPPPSRSLFGSSYAAPNTFGRKGHTPARRGFAMPESSPPPAVAEGDENEDAEYSEDDFMAEGRRDAAPEMDRSAFASSLMSSTRGMKRSRNGRPKEQAIGDYGAIAKSMAGRPQTKLGDPDDLMLRQEDTVHRMDELANTDASGRDAAVEEGVVDLTKLWGQHAQMETKEAGLGPVAEDDTTRANYLSSLLLQLHHPHAVKGPQQQTRAHRALSGARKASSAGNTTVPRALLDWLNTYHIPFPDDYDTVWRYQPSPSAHERFWDAVYYSLIRGKYDQAIRLLSDAGWDNALIDEEDTDGTSFSERQLDHIEHVVEACINLLRTCPALKYGDWNVKGNDWAVFRQRARTALRNLESYAGEPDEDEEQDELGASRGGGNVFNQSHSMAMSAASRRAESKVPWSIYENLKLLYSVVLGDVDALCDTSQDWLEASIYLTVWWDGEAGDPAEPVSLRASQSMRKSLTGSKRAKTREVDVAPGTAYRKRLAEAFVLVVDTGEDVVFQPDTLDPVQVGLACIFTENVEAVFSLLRSWSLPITSGVVEVASLGGWMPHARPRGKDGLLQRGFSSEDLMVLSHGPASNPSQSGEMERDEVLSDYAEALAKKQLLKSTDGKIEREGWELAVEVLGRLGDTKVSEQKVRDVLEGLDLEGEARVDKVLSACRSLSLDEEARGIAERYADNLAFAEEGVQPAYGSALIYYARAHAVTKLKDLLTLLTSCCLLHSAAYPFATDLDTQLASLLSKDRLSLVGLAREDPDAASLLAKSLSGYATVRRFYYLRDQDLAPDATTTLRPLERKREAAKALVAVTESAADCIRGGLYDPAVESVIAVDCVLALLAESLPLLGQPKRVFTKEQVFGLLRVVEDFATAPSRIRENAESLMLAAVSAYRDHDDGVVAGAGGAGNKLKKSRQTLKQSAFGGSSYDLLASSIMPGGAQQQKTKGDGSKGAQNSTASPIQRSWDWRRGLDGLGGGVDAGGKEVLGLLRMALAQEVARGWSGQVSW